MKPPPAGPLNIYWLALTMLSQTNGPVWPLSVRRFVGPEAQGACSGALRLWRPPEPAHV